MKFCSNCGNEIEEDQFFCIKCGTKVEDAPSPFEMAEQTEPDNSAEAESPAAEIAPAEPAAPKKKPKKGFIIGAIAVIVAALGAGAVFGLPYIRSLLGKQSPGERFAEAINKKIEAAADIYSAQYGIYAEGKTAEIELSGTSSDEFKAILRPLASSNSPELESVLNWIDTFNLKYTIASDETAVQASTELSVNDTALGSMVVTAEKDTEKVYTELPGLSDKALVSEASGENGLLGAMYTDMPDGDTIKAIMTEYGKAATDEIKNVTEDSAKLSAGSFSKEYTTLTAEIDSETAQNIATAVLTKLKSDKDLKALMTGMYAPGADDSAFTESIDSAIESIDSIRLDNNLIITLYVDDDNNIFGTEIAMDAFKITYADIEDGGQFYSELTIASDIDSNSFNATVMSGQGTVTDGKRTGTYSYAINAQPFMNMELCEIAVTDYDGVNGSATITIASDGAEFIETFLGADISELVISTSNEQTDSTKKSSLSISNGDEKIMSLDADITVTDGTDIAIPSDTLSEDTELEDWYRSIDFTKLTTNLIKSRMPLDILNIVTAPAAEITGSDSIIPDELKDGLGDDSEGENIDASIPDQTADNIARLKSRLASLGIDISGIDFDSIDVENILQMIDVLGVDADTIRSLLNI